MSDKRLYFPVLRNKRAEWTALSELARDVADKVMPILEPLPLNVTKEGVDGVAENLGLRMGTSWGRKAFCDAHNLRDGDAVRVLSRLAKSGAGRSGQIIPVMRADNSEEILAVLDRWAAVVGRLAIRLKMTPNFDENVERLRQRAGQKRSAITLIVDLGIVDEDTELRKRDVAEIASAEEFRDVVFLGGAFPKNLTGFKVGIHRHPRHDWALWQRTRAWTADGIRAMKFGDYTIQHPAYEEPQTKLLNVSASIRYAADDYWIIMRGEGLRNPGGAGAAQWPANAMLLADRDEYKGSGFSAGDAYVASKVGDFEKTGNPETWLRAGINHHITLTVRQLESTYES